MSAGVYVRTSGAHVAERIRPAAGSEDEKRLLALAEDPTTDWSFTPDEAADPELPPDPQRPAKAAAKDAWVAWAVHSGAEQAEAEALTKEQLIETYGGTPA